jgi:putative SOS response-associated peptidase YedK
MCGRYRLSRRKQIIVEHFDSVSGEEDWSPRYNIAPTQPVPVIRQHPKEPIRALSLMRWGLIPSGLNHSRPRNADHVGEGVVDFRSFPSLRLQPEFVCSVLAGGAPRIETGR